MTKRNKMKIPDEKSLEIKQFGKILIIVVVILLVFYFFTRLFITKDLFKKYDLNDYTNEAIEFNYNAASIGTVFNRPYDEYYVFIFDTTKVSNEYYTVILNAYDTSESGIKIYLVDLNNPFNSPYIKEESNPKATKAEELAVKDGTLIKIRKGKINKYLEEKELIQKELAVK